jgi:hypothetical protein
VVLYGGENELHEFAVSASLGDPSVEGEKVIIHRSMSSTVVQWQVEPSRRIIQFGNSLENSFTLAE